MRKLKFALLFLLPLGAWAQQKITLSDIYRKGTFRSEFVQAKFDGDVNPSQPNFNELGLKKADGSKIRVAGSIASKDAQPKYIIKEDVEAIYRRSSKAYIYLYDGISVKQITDGKVLHPSFSPDGKKIAFVKDNNIFIYDIASANTITVTTDGKWNEIINGNCDWVYEEEFGFSQAYEWSANSTFIAYYRFDESKVKEFSFTYYNNDHNQEYQYKYPKAGDDNSKVDIYIYDIASNKKTKANYPQGDIYIPRIKWTSNDNELLVYWMNRHQNDLKLYKTTATTGSSTIIYEEKNKYYVDINDDWFFNTDGKTVVFTSEQDGFTNMYQLNLHNSDINQITKNKFDLANIVGIDEKTKTAYYLAAYPTPMDRTLFAVNLTGKNNQVVSQGIGSRSVIFNKTFTQYFDNLSTINTPQTTTLFDIKNKKGKITAIKNKTINENTKLNQIISNYGFGKVEFIQVPNRLGVMINGFILKPSNFDPNKKYPVLFSNYSGPGSQTVSNRFGAANNWHQMLAQKGFIIVAFDNTGTGYRGEEFKKKTYLQLGKYEIEDQIDMAKWMANQPYVDKDKIGHWGWSFGGFMSSLAITKGAEVFSAAIAVAPVTNWRYYDNIYTERYMRTPQENEKGYDQNSPIYFTDKLKGKYLLIHGTADDNVHFQNATQMVTALVKSNKQFDSFYYPNKNHGISGSTDNTTMHLYTMMTNWILKNLGNDNTDNTPIKE